MPWSQLSPMHQKTQFIADYLRRSPRRAERRRWFRRMNERRQGSPMSDYRPYRVPGGNYFFTIYRTPDRFLGVAYRAVAGGSEVYDSRATIPLSTPGSCFPITCIA